MFPFIEVVPLSELNYMSKHSGEELLLEISFRGSDLQLVEILSKSSLHNTVKDCANIA